MAQKNNLTIQVVSIIGGILTAIFFLGFLVVASISRTETSSLIIGCLFIYPDNKSPAHSSFSGCNEYHSVHRRMCTDCLWTKQKYKCSLYCTCDNRHFHFLLIERFHLTFPFCHSIYYFFSRRVSLFIFVNTTFANSSSPGFSSFPVHQSIRKEYPDRIKGKLSFQIHTFPFRLIRFLYLLISRIVC